MRLTKLLFRTLRETPAEGGSAALRLLVRAGYAAPLAPGSLALLPLGRRVLGRLERLAERELAPLGFEAVDLPGGESAADGARTPGEAIVEAVVRSYRQLPARFFAAPDGRTIEGWSADTDPSAAEGAHDAILAAWRSVIGGAGATPVVAEAGVAGLRAERLVVLEGGDETVAVCDGCGLAATVDAGRSPVAPPPAEPLLPVEEVATPDTPTIAALAALLRIGPGRTAKAAFFTAEDGRLVTAIVRGDFEVSVPKLAAAAGARELRPASVERIREAGMEPGYGSPVGAGDTFVVVDEVAAASPNLVAGANDAGYHLRNVNVGRDFVPDLVADVRRVRAGDPCPSCGASLRIAVAASLAEVAALRPAAAPEYLGRDGGRHSVALTGFRIDLGRLLESVAAAHADERGLVWPAAVAPFPVGLVALGSNRPEIRDVADALYDELCGAGFEPLYDDRDESPGVKLTDAELLGLPLVAVVSGRSIEAGGVELRRRSSGERWTAPREEVVRLVAEVADQAGAV